MPITIRETLAALIVAGLCSACGGGGGGSSSGSQPPPAGGVQPPPPPANRAPGTHPPQGITAPDFVDAHPVDFDVARFFVDPDGDPIAYRIAIKQAAADGTWEGLRIEQGRIVGIATNRIANRPVVQSGVTVDLDDGRGGTHHTEFVINIRQNASPVVVVPGADRFVTVGTTLDVDVGDVVFSDADGDPMTYEISLAPLARGLSVSGTRVRGTLDSNGAVFVRVRANDGFGGTAEDAFAIVAPVIETRRPTLPAVPFVYDDAQLTLPFVVRFSREGFASLWDTTRDSNNPPTNAGATLGRVLFYDKRLSVTNMGSCGSCHHQDHGFAAPERFSAGPQGELTKRNVMGLTGVRYNLQNDYFGDRRVHGLERLIREPIEAPAELGNSMSMLVDKLSAADFYPPLFADAFGSPEITADRITQALAQFLRSMIAFDSRFDRAYLPMNASDVATPEAVLTPQELRGAEIFNGPGRCTFCHAQGAQTMDAVTNNALDVVPADPGSGNGNFRIASLRNIAVTAPYMHDGRFATLREVIEHYSSGIVDTPAVDVRLRGMVTTNSPNLNLSDADKDALEAFLHTFTDHQFLSDPRFSDPFL